MEKQPQKAFVLGMPEDVDSIIERMNSNRADKIVKSIRSNNMFDSFDNRPDIDNILERLGKCASSCRYEISVRRYINTCIENEKIIEAQQEHIALLQEHSQNLEQTVENNINTFIDLEEKLKNKPNSKSLLDQCTKEKEMTEKAAFFGSLMSTGIGTALGYQMGSKSKSTKQKRRKRRSRTTRLRS